MACFFYYISGFHSGANICYDFLVSSNLAIRSICPITPFSGFIWNGTLEAFKSWSGILWNLLNPTSKCPVSKIWQFFPFSGHQNPKCSILFHHMCMVPSILPTNDHHFPDCVIYPIGHLVIAKSNSSILEIKQLLQECQHHFGQMLLGWSWYLGLEHDFEIFHGTNCR